MAEQIIALVLAVIGLIVGIGKYQERKRAAKAEAAQKAKEELDNANKNDDASSLLDSFGRLRRR